MYKGWIKDRANRDLKIKLAKMVDATNKKHEVDNQENKKVSN